MDSEGECEADLCVYIRGYMRVNDCDSEWAYLHMYVCMYKYSVHSEGDCEADLCLYLHGYMCIHGYTRTHTWLHVL